MQFTTVLVSVLVAVTGTHGQPFAAVIDRYTQQGCTPFGSPGGGSFILNPTACNAIPAEPGARSIIVRQLFPGCNST